MRPTTPATTNLLNNNLAARRATRTAIITAAFMVASALSLSAGTFTQGNLVVERLGDGTQVLANSGNTIFFDEITTNGALVQSIQIPSTGATPLVDAGGSSAATEGGVTLSADGKSLVFPGYVLALPSVIQPATNFGTVVPRGVGKLDLNGNFTLAATSFGATNSAYSGSTFRGAASDGTNNFWGSGTYFGSPDDDGGVWYFGSNAPQAQVYYPTHTANLRCIGIYNGNLWFDTASSTALGYGFWYFNGFPTVSNTPTRAFATTSTDSEYNFSVSPDGTVIYYSDDGSLLSANAGIHKLVFSGGVWSSNIITVPTSSAGTNSFYGLTVDWTQLPVKLYATTGSGAASNSVVSLFDTGPNSTFTVIASAGATNKMYRGVIFAPATSQPGSTPASPTITGITPGSLTTNAGSYLSFVPSGTPGTPVASNYWFQVTSGTTNLAASGSAAAGAALTFVNLQPTSAGSYFLVLSNASGAVTSSVVTLTVNNNPRVLSLSPSGAFTNLAGTLQTFTLQFDSGSPAATTSWYYIGGSSPSFTTNLITWAPTNTATTLSLTNLQSTNSGGYFAVLANTSGSSTSSVANMSVTSLSPPVISGITPSNTLTVNAGATIPFVLNASQGVPVASNFWYKITGVTTSLVSTAFSFTLTNVGLVNTGSYFAVLTNSSGAATSPVVALSVTNDLNIVVEPSSAQGLVKGTVQFAVLAGGTTPFAYQWYFSDTNGNLIAPVASLGDGSAFYGANGSILTFSNLQPADMTNFMVVVTNIYGSVTSTVASILTGTNVSGLAGTGIPYENGVLALWDFDGPQFTANPQYFPYVNYPAPFIGYGTASPVGTTYNPNGLLTGGAPNNQSPFAGATDPFDVGFDPNVGAYVYTPFGFDQASPNGSWGTDNYPLIGTNKANGVQFNVSTLGAKNIRVSYDSRVSGTASDYERLQYTTNGTTWIDYPASSTFDNVGSTYFTYQYSLVGFPGVDNNTNFGIRIVTEWQSTATYQTAATMANTNNPGVNGVFATNTWVGTANSYASGSSSASNAAAGTVTYDVVAFIADAITNNNTPPTLTFSNFPVSNGLAFTNMVDTNTLVLNVSASSLQFPPTSLTVSAATLSTVSAGTYVQTVNPTIVTNHTTSTNFTITISFSSGIPDTQDGSPILVTATDPNGESTAAWFMLTVSSLNQPPTNTLTAIHDTNVLANTSLQIPFTAGGVADGTTNLTFNFISDNTTVIPVGNISVTPTTNYGKYVLTVTPAAGQVGNSLINVSVIDNSPSEVRSNTANINVLVRPNTNAVAVDYFNYDTAGASLDTEAAGYWNHLSGVLGQLQVGSGAATIAVGNTENLQAPLLGSPYTIGGGGVLYSSFTVNMNAGQMPTANGSYFFVLNDGSGNTADVEDCVVAATNDAAPGYFRLGVGNVVGATAATAQMFPLDLQPDQTYFVITALSLNNGQSAIWVSPTNLVSMSVTDTTATTTYNINDVELRESGVNQGTIKLGSLLVGKSFNSVFYPPSANPATFSVAENSIGNLLNPLAIDGGSGLSLANVSETDGNGTASISGTEVSFTPAHNFLGTATINYTLMDDMGNTASSTISVSVNVPLTPIPLIVSVASGHPVITWTNAALNLQSATNVLGPWTTIPGASSPYNIPTTNAADFFRLVH